MFSKAGCQVTGAACDLLSSHPLHSVLEEHSDGRPVSESPLVFSVSATPSWGCDLKSAFVLEGDRSPRYQLWALGLIPVAPESFGRGQRERRARCSCELHLCVPLVLGCGLLALLLESGAWRAEPSPQMNHRVIIESLRLEQTAKVISAGRQPSSFDLTTGEPPAHCWAVCFTVIFSSGTGRAYKAQERLGWGSPRGKTLQIQFRAQETRVSSSLQ